MNSASPSFHSLVCRSNVRGVDATVKLATAAPEGVNLSSGSSVRLPMTVMTVSPAMTQPFGFGVSDSSEPQRCDTCEGSRAVLVDISVLGSGLLHVGTCDLGAHNGLVERELTIELLDRGRLRLELDDGVDALVLLVDLVGEAALAPHVDVVDGAAVLAYDVEVRVQAGGDGAFFEIRIEDDHDFIRAQ